MKPSLLLIDSIQTLFDPEFESGAGSVSQVRGCAQMLARWAKGTGTPLVLVGHVTKDGGLAGPKVLEHLVDTVLSFEGDRHHHHRLLRSLKNRFGAAFELGVFAMTEKGLTAAEGNPFFLDAEPRPGCAATVILSGTRPMVVEIQALVASAGLGIPRRTALGIDGQRLAMLCAVAERRGGVQLHDRDVYLNVAGGLDIEDPAADLAVLAALASSATGRLLAPKCLFMGEVGLTGEVRPRSPASPSPPGRRPPRLQRRRRSAPRPRRQATPPPLRRVLRRTPARQGLDEGSRGRKLNRRFRR